MLRSRFITALLALALLLAANLLNSQGAYAQLSGGVGFRSYQILSGDGQGRYLGEVIVIARTDKLLPETIMLPEEFKAGAEYWYWANESEAYPDAFLLTPNESVKLPSESISDYDLFAHLAFDLTAAHSFPKVSVDASMDRVYTVHVGDDAGKPLDTTAEAWFVFQNQGKGAQLAWARKDLGASYLGLDKDQSLLFVSSALPAAGSMDVVPAR